jgi:hypothetical protein
MMGGGSTALELLMLELTQPVNLMRERVFPDALGMKAYKSAPSRKIFEIEWGLLAPPILPKD